VGATSFKYVAMVDVLCDMLYLSATILPQKEQDVKLDKCNDLKTGTKNSPPKGIIHRHDKKTRFGKIHDP